jgi:hypothetical protein
MWECGSRCLGSYVFVLVGSVMVCYYLVYALRIDVAKMWAVDVVFTSAFVGMGCVFRMLSSKHRVMFLLFLYGNYVYDTRCLESW